MILLHDVFLLPDVTSYDKYFLITLICVYRRVARFAFLPQKNNILEKYNIYEPQGFLFGTNLKIKTHFHDLFITNLLICREKCVHQHREEHIFTFAKQAF